MVIDRLLKWPHTCVTHTVSMTVGSQFYFEVIQDCVCDFQFLNLYFEMWKLHDDVGHVPGRSVTIAGLKREAFRPGALCG